MSKIIFKRLGEIATFVNGYAFKSKDWSTYGLPIIRIQNLNNINAPFNYFNSNIDEKYLVKKGDILISWSGSIGIYEWQGNEAVLNQHIFKVNFNKDEINKTYFKYIVQMSLMRALQYVHGSTMKHITKKYFDEILVPVPDLITQQKIAEVLRISESLINKRKAQIAALSSLTQSVFLEMFGDPRLNPKGFKIESLGNLSTHVSSGSTPKGGQKSYLSKGIPLIRSQNVLMNRLNLDNVAYISEETHQTMNRSKVKNRDVLFNITGASIGRVAVYTGKDNQANVNQHVCIIRVNENLNPYYLSYFISSNHFQNNIKANNSGATREAFNYTQIKNFVILLPDISIQNLFEKRLELIDRQKTLLEISLNQLENSFHSLMHRAFKGELFND